MTAGTHLNDIKEKIKMGLKHSKICVGEDENGYVYETATKQEVTEEILRLFDEVAYMALSSMDSGRALDRCIRELNPGLKEEDIFKAYMKFIAEENGKFNDYRFENNMDIGEKKKIPFTVINGGKKE